MRIDLPTPVAWIIVTLESAGFEAYAVGGCIRDSILGNPPEDWDIATAATPEEVIAAFGDTKVLGTGLRHGTVTVMPDGVGYEVTTFRVDGGYSDHRRPDSVAFTRSIGEDLARRDFTVGAMAWNPKTGLVDPFGGQEDLSRGRLACVGDPATRFREDALRVFRALRFASTLDFAVEPKTAAAMRGSARLLAHVSAERIRAELDKALLGPGVLRAFTEHAEVITEVIPELLPAIGFDQRNDHHNLDVWRHTLAAVALAKRDRIVRLALLLHDVAKPLCLTVGEDGVGHFRGHAAKGADMAAAILARLRYDGDTARAVERLVRCHSTRITPDERNLLRWLKRIGEADLRRLLAVKRGDLRAHAPWCAKEGERRMDAAEQALDAVLAAGLCYRLRDLAVDGSDLMSVGVREGPDVGRSLDMLLDRVIDRELPNDRAALLRYVEQNPHA